MGKHNNKETGNLGEMIAAKFLEKRGFRVVVRNYRRRFGEVDIIARKGSSIHFVEVKSIKVAAEENISRENNGYRPEELVNPLKLRKIGLVANEYMMEQPKELDFQIDVVAVFIDQKRRIGRCRYTENVC